MGSPRCLRRRRAGRRLSAQRRRRLPAAGCAALRTGSTSSRGRPRWRRGRAASRTVPSPPDDDGACGHTSHVQPAVPCEHDRLVLSATICGRGTSAPRGRGRGLGGILGGSGIGCVRVVVPASAHIRRLLVRGSIGWDACGGVCSSISIGPSGSRASISDGIRVAIHCGTACSDSSAAAVTTASATDASTVRPACIAVTPDAATDVRRGAIASPSISCSDAGCTTGSPFNARSRGGASRGVDKPSRLDVADATSDHSRRIHLPDGRAEAGGGVADTIGAGVRVRRRIWPLAVPPVSGFTRTRCCRKRCRQRRPEQQLWVRWQPSVRRRT